MIYRDIRTVSLPHIFQGHFHFPLELGDGGTCSLILGDKACPLQIGFAKHKL